MRKSLPEPTEKRVFVQTMFARIAKRYDVLNKILSFGYDSSLRKRVVCILQPEAGKKYLDIGCGTGDLAKEIVFRQPHAVVIACDLTYQMIFTGRGKTCNPNIIWVVADAGALPFQGDTFDGVVSGYLLRNVPDVKKALNDQFRVMRHGVRIIALDTTPPERNWFYPLIMVYLLLIIPIIGFIVSRDQTAYSYLPDSTMVHISAEKLKSIFVDAGFVSVEYFKLLFGTMAIHSGRKPGTKP